MIAPDQAIAWLDYRTKLARSKGHDKVTMTVSDAEDIMRLLGSLSVPAEELGRECEHRWTHTLQDTFRKCVKCGATESLLGPQERWQFCRHAWVPNLTSDEGGSVCAKCGRTRP